MFINRKIGNGEKKMKKINDIFMNKFVPFLTKVGNNRYLAAIRDGISITIPFTIIGSILLVGEGSLRLCLPLALSS